MVVEQDKSCTVRTFYEQSARNTLQGDAGGRPLVASAWGCNGTYVYA